jgi:hypothetical protein
MAHYVDIMLTGPVREAEERTMTDLNHRWKADPAKWRACGRLEELGAIIGGIDATREHVELHQRHDGTPIGDADIAGIVRDMNTLGDATTLDLSESEISDACAPELSRLNSVTDLYLGGVKLTDASVAHVAAIPTLRVLSLGDTLISDSGLFELAKAKNLRWVQLTGARVTKRGIARLKRALPNLEVEFY